MKQHEIYLTNLEPIVGSEINKIRPCVVVSPDTINYPLRTVIIAPLSTKIKSYPSRIKMRFKGKVCEIILDQLRTIDKSRLIKRLGSLNEDVRIIVKDKLIEMFS